MNVDKTRRPNVPDNNLPFIQYLRLVLDSNVCLAFSEVEVDKLFSVLCESS